MPQRVYRALIGLAGLFAVAGMFLIGRDVWALAREGPRWRRRLIGAGLLLLATLGLISCASKQDGKEATTASPRGSALGTAGTSLAETDKWKHVVAVWREAEEIASWRRGDYPFDEAGKNRLLAELAALPRTFDALAAARFLSEPEAGLLQAEAALLAPRLEELRPVEMLGGTCYETMLIPFPHAKLRLERRLPLLESLAESGALRPEVLSRVLDTIESDIAGLERSDWDEAVRVREVSKAALTKLRERAAREADRAGEREGRLEDAPEWRVIASAWDAALSLAESGTSTVKERELITARLDEAAEAWTALALAGQLTWTEARELRRDVETLQWAVCRKAPTGADARAFGGGIRDLHSPDAMMRLDVRLSPEATSSGRVPLRPAVLRLLVSTYEMVIEMARAEVGPPDEVYSDGVTYGQMVEKARAKLAGMKKLLEKAKAE